jgi:hypothetical protein
VNDLARDLGPLEWTWEAQIDGQSVADGAGEMMIPADSVTSVGEIETKLAHAGKGTLVLALFGDGIKESNAYDFVVTSRLRREP